MKSSSSLYNNIVKYISKRSLPKYFRASDLRKVLTDKYSANTYSSFLAKHCCDGWAKNGKNSRGYKIYFCRIDTGLYSLAQKCIARFPCDMRKYI